MTNFCSDNTTGACPEVLAAVTAANEGQAMPYGEDPWTELVQSRVSELFETDCAVFPVATGTAANALALAPLAPPHGVVYCHKEAHIQVDECNAPELYTGGAKLIAIEGPHGKLTPQLIAGAVTGAGIPHHPQPAAISLTQATEAGTVYTPDEVGALGELARRHGLGLHMDGARFANALASLGCAPAEVTWKAGVDVLALGATKNGAFAAEAVVFFKPDLARDFAYRRKRGGHLFSKMRFVSAQLEAYLAGDLWLANARHANAMAARLAEGLAGLPGVAVHHPVEANMIFAALPGAVGEALRAAGFQFYDWGPEARREVRLVTAFNTRAEDVQAFLATARAAAEAGADAVA